MENVLFQVILQFMGKNVGNIVFSSVLAGLVFFQWRNITYSRRSAESSEETNKRLNDTVPSISKRILSVVENSALINVELDRLLNSLGADRAYVYMFHNAGHDFTGQPFAKITNTNEATREGFGSCIEKMKDIPIGILANFISTLLRNGEIRCPDIEKYKATDKTAYAYLYNLGIKSTYTIALFSPTEGNISNTVDGRQRMGSIPIGFVGIDYLRGLKDLSEDEFKSFHSMAMTIKGLLLERRNIEVEKIKEQTSKEK